MAEKSVKKSDKKSDAKVTKDSLVSAKDLGEIAGFSAQYLGKLAKDEGLAKDPSGKFRLGDAWKFFVEYAVRHAERPGDQDDSKTRILATRARLEELKLAKELSQTITVDAVIDELEPVLGNLRAQLLTIPKKLAPILRDGMTPGEREAIITKVVHDALRELTTLPDRVKDIPPPVEEETEESSPDE